MKPRLANVNQTTLAYATPIRQHRYPNVEDLNRQLTQKILELPQKSPGKQLSNVGGWHSDSKLLVTLGEPLGTQLAKMFVENVRAAIDVMVELSEPLPNTVSVEGWANVNTRGDSNTMHIHGGCPWSGVYYVASDPSPTAAGELTFADPRTAALMISHPYNPFKGANRIKVTPEPGLMVVFPSFLYHGVEPYQGDSPRISVALNML